MKHSYQQSAGFLTTLFLIWGLGASCNSDLQVTVVPVDCAKLQESGSTEGLTQSQIQDCGLGTETSENPSETTQGSQAGTQETTSASKSKEKANTKKVATEGGSQTSADTTAPAVPTAVTLTASYGSQLDFSFTKATDTDLASQNIKACTGEDCATGCNTEEADSESPSSITGLADGSYYGCVQSVDTAGNVSAFTPSSTSFLVDTAAPTAPSAVSLPTILATSANVSFTVGADSNFSSHNVKACASNDCATGCLSAVQSATSPASLASLVDGQSYYACVQTVDLAGLASAFVASASSGTVDATNPAAPSGISITESSPLNGTDINISFTDGTDTNFSTHNIKACTDSDCSANCVGATTDAASPSAISSLVDGNTYYACVQSEDQGGNTSAFVDSGSSITIDTTDPAAPSGISITESSPLDANTINISFTDGTDTHFSTHNIKACTDSGCSANCVGATTDAASPAAIGSLVDGSTYYACVQSLDAVSRTSSFVASGSTIIVDNTNPAAPSSVDIITTSPTTATSLSVGFTNGTDANFTTHNVKACTNAGCSDNCVGSSTDAASPAPIGSLVAGSTYYACIQSVDGVSRTSAYVASTDQLQINHLAPPDPTSPSASPDSTTAITVSWTSGGGTTSDYRMAYKTGGTAPTDCASDTQIGEGSISGVSHQVTGLTPEQQYSFLVCAINANGTPDASSGVSASATTNSEADPPDPTGESGTVNSDVAITLDWTSGGGTTAGYRIAYDTGGTAPTDCSSGTQIGEGSISGVAHQVTGLTGSTQYSFRICAINGNTTADVSAGVTVTATTLVSATPRWRELVTGDNHTCGLTDEGLAYCWGSDTQGQLGNGATSGQQDDPILVAGSHSFISLTAGGSHTCGIEQTGQSYCWGYDSLGQLGNGAGTTAQQDPVLITGSHSFISLTAGTNHTCGLKQTGESYCWGYDAFGQLGNGAGTTAQQDPVLVTGSHSFVSLTAGSNHTCGIKQTGESYCWGKDSDGQLGNGAGTTAQQDPVLVTGSHTFTSLTAGGSHTCGLKQTGESYCWGRDQYGQLGEGAGTTTQQDPVLVTGSHGFISLTAGSTHSCGIKQTGESYCWGYDSYGQLGNGAGTTTPQQDPVLVTGSHSFVALTGSSYHTCGLRQTGEAYCWGRDNNSQLGNGATSGDQSDPVTVDVSNVAATKATFREVVAGKGFYHTCGLSSSGEAHCWGYEGDGQLGNGAGGQQFIPGLVTGTHKFITIDVGGYHTCGLKQTGETYCWGSDGDGQLGNGATTGDQVDPVLVTGSHEFIAITTGERHTCGLRQTGETYCWGWDEDGQLGEGNGTGDQVSPVLVTGSHTFIYIKAGSRHTCAINQAGETYCWGMDGDGQLGHGGGVDEHDPVLVNGSHAFTSIAAGFAHTCGITQSGDAYCWGRDVNGQLGEGADADDQVEPVLVTGSHKFTSISAASYNTCAIKQTGEAYCWGEDDDGQLGEGADSDDQHDPVLVTGSHNFISISAGNGRTCGIRQTGETYCWGGDLYGELGNGGTTGDQHDPSLVIMDNVTP